jgi:ParB/RepB/Spo0J family partition protein
MTATATETLTGQLLELPLDQLHPSTDNPRRDVGDVVELATSIRSMGILEPLVVTPNGDGYIVVAGHRRLAAAELAALETVPCVVRELDERERLAAMLVENLQRTDLQPLEEANAYHRLVDEFGHSQRELAEKVGRSQGHISKRLALLELPESVRADVDSGGIALADAVALSRLAGDEERIRAAIDDTDNWTTIEKAVERQLEQKTRQDTIDQRVEELRAAGKNAVAQVVFVYQTKLPKGAFRIAKSATYGAVLLIDPRTHAKEPCHAIAVGEKPSDDVIVCTNRRNHPGLKTADQRRHDASSKAAAGYEQKDRKRDQLREVADGRLAFVVQLLKRKNAFGKNEALELILRQAIENSIANGYGEYVAAFREVMGLDPKASIHDQINTWAAAGLADLTRAAIAATILDLESQSCNPWHGATRGWDEDDAAWLAFLESRGYELTELERETLPKPKKTAKKAA